MSHNIYDYPKLPPMAEALSDLDKVPIANTSLADAQETTTIAAIKGQLLYSAPVNAYVGATAITNEVPFGNFKIRINGLATEITTIAGTETVEIYLGTLWGAGAAQGFNYNAQVLTAGTWFQIDNWVLDTGDDMGTYWVCRSAIADPEWYQVKLWRPLPGKCAIEASRMAFAGPNSAGGPVLNTTNAIAIAAPDLTTNVNGTPASVPLSTFPDYFSSITATPFAPKGPDSTTLALAAKIRRESYIGLGVDPTSWIHTQSFATRTVNHFGPAIYVTTLNDHTIRFAQGCPACGVTFHSPAPNPGQILIVINSSNFVQQMAIQAPQPITGIGLQTTLEPGESITIQSFTTNWCVIDHSIIDNVYKNVAIGTAFADALISLGELRFTYGGNASGLDMQVQSSSNTPVIFNYFSSEQYALQTTFNQISGVNITGPGVLIGWANCTAGGAGVNEIVRYDVITAKSHYKATLSNWQGTRIHLAVERSGL